ncbi:OLC1v1006534C2 [Oldenlandia corymbosa var. corymbosa]|uniref:OLC1v1006534C2 n=1 Tax=Oldenlandia corymbosa var. corymbosa TaxID=529605 RepID=A0AAV1DHW7_OLDCO|nr:OLC1v1006534C2 [Oldenlandia corymbosa var. corymbosa]
MDDLDVLARGYGFRPQGKSNPMRSEAGDRRSASTRSSFTAIYDDDHGGRGGDGGFFNGGPPKYYSYSNSNSSKPSSGMDDFDYDSIFNSSAAPASGGNSNSTKTTSAPVYDKPVYDDDIFNGLPGVKSKSVSSASMGRFDDDGFSSVASPPGWSSTGNSNTRIDEPDDLLGKLGQSEGETRKTSSTSTGFEFLDNLTRKEPVPEVKSSSRSSSSRGFDDILNGLGSGNPASSKRPVSESSRDPKSSSNVIHDPFVVLETSSPVSSTPGIFTDPLEEIGNLGKSGTTKPDTSAAAGGVFDFLDPLNGFGTSATPFSPDKSRMEKEKSPSRSSSRVSETQTAGNREHILRSSFKQSESHFQRNAPEESLHDSPLFDMPNASANAPQNSVRQNASSPPPVSEKLNGTNSQPDMSPRSEEHAQQYDDVWLTVSEVPLFTQPTSAPPPSRPPPPIPRRTSTLETGSFPSNARKKSDDFASPPGYSAYAQSPKGFPDASKGAPGSQIDELEDFARGSTRNSVDKVNFHSGEEMNASSAAVASAAAMKEAMDIAEAKFRHAKEVREREYAKVARSRESTQLDKDEQAMLDAQEREFRENQERLEQEQRKREEEEREKRRLEKERERERAREIENARARQAVERATREARERAAAEARLKADRAAQAVAREKAERQAVLRAQAEARERLAAEAKERVEKAAAEAREKANAEAREKEARDRAAAEAQRRAERAAAERATAEARERAAAEARGKAANAARTDQQRYDNNDLESFFGAGSRPSSAPRPRASSPDTNKPNTSNAPNMRKTSSAANVLDDLSSLIGVPGAATFEEIPGESAERRKARWEREERVRKRAMEAVAEKNKRDLEAKEEQEKRDKLAETMDIEIKRWAAGKEGNLRALLSTLQYVLWPECGWQPVSLTDLITAISVKKVYRKATLCIHPDKVQQKGATSEQKYVAAKVFDLLKEAWNKFNSEELF